MNFRQLCTRFQNRALKSSLFFLPTQNSRNFPPSVNSPSPPDFLNPLSSPTINISLHIIPGRLLGSFLCQSCGRRYTRRDNLLRHERLECKTPPQYQCPYCPHKLRRRDSLRTHVALKHEKLLQWLLAVAECFDVLKIYETNKL